MMANKMIYERVLQRDEFVCQKCLNPKQRKELIVHHKKRKVDGGKDEIDNLLTLCRKCHEGVHKKYNPHIADRDNEVNKKLLKEKFNI